MRTDVNDNAFENYINKFSLFYGSVNFQDVSFLSIDNGHSPLRIFSLVSICEMISITE